MRQPSLVQDRWDLESGEERHAAFPDSFWIPSRRDRERLRPGLLVKLLFRIETEEASGSTEIAVERMWVYITERLDEGMVGVLDSNPASVAPTDDVYLCLGAEIPFLPEHVVEITEPSEHYVQVMDDAVPTRRWPRG